MTTLKTGKYSSVFATETHEPITDVNAFKRRWTIFTMGFFLNGKAIGKGDLEKQGKGVVHTDGVRLFKPFRKKGHGIKLYVHLIETARLIGAKRVYSSTNLNKFSRRMWKEKLLALYDVKTVLERKPCDTCGSMHKREKYYYIKFKD